MKPITSFLVTMIFGLILLSLAWNEIIELRISALVFLIFQATFCALSFYYKNKCDAYEVDNDSK